MSFNVNTYNPSLVSLAFGGYILTGWNTISIERVYDGFTPVDGIRGKNSRVRNRNTAALISFSCLQTGEANDLLSQIHELDLQTGAARISLTLRDLSGTSIFSSDEAYILAYPDVTYSDSFEYRVWQIRCNSSDGWLVGGNLTSQDSLFTKVTGFIGDTLSSIF